MKLKILIRRNLFFKGIIFAVLDNVYSGKTCNFILPASNKRAEGCFFYQKAPQARIFGFFGPIGTGYIKFNEKWLYHGVGGRQKLVIKPRNL